MRYDLHVHTYFSDGLHSPATVINNALDRGLDGISITDHDTVLGLEEATLYSNKFDNFNVIPGIELSCIYENNEVHILGYFIDYSNDRLISTTNELRKHRLTRIEKIVGKLSKLKIDVDIEKIKEKNDNDFIGRVAVARELVSKGYVSNTQEAFSRYLNPGKPAHVERYKLSIDDAISLIKGADGIPVLAHPGLIKDKYLVQLCIDKGIEGIECIHSKHTQSQTKNFKNLANRHNLIVTGGSDCHGDLTNGELLLGKYYIDLSLIPKMKERIK
ncbi:MAG: PHP domain-containing protein [Tissierellaceae bacterium]|nr:PHP domain-containing protein [Tissierellaceae bacterium]